MKKSIIFYYIIYEEVFLKQDLYYFVSIFVSIKHKLLIFIQIKNKKIGVCPNLF